MAKKVAKRPVPKRNGKPKQGSHSNRNGSRRHIQKRTNGRHGKP